MSQYTSLWTVAETVVSTRAVTLRKLQPEGRLVLRIAPADQATFEAACDIALPSRIGARTVNGGVDCAMLGPDEWQIKGPLAVLQGLVHSAQGIAAATPHSLVDVSAREVSFAITGPKAEVLLTLGMARDPRSLPESEARRTNMDGLTVVLRREDAQSFVIDVWNSFADHLWHLLETGAHELSAA